jgi:hypothetical protein
MTAAGRPCLGDDHPAVLAFEAVDHLRKAVLHLGQRHMLGCGHGQKYG